MSLKLRWLTRRCDCYKTLEAAMSQGCHNSKIRFEIADGVQSPPGLCQNSMAVISDYV